MEIKLAPKNVARFLGWIVLFFSLAHAAGLFSRFVLGHDTVFGLIDLFDLNSEKNLPTFYASASLLFCAALLALIAVMRWPNREWIFWAILTVVFAFLSYDEAAAIHESLGQTLQDAWNTSGYIRYAWIIPYGIIALVLLIGSTWVLRSIYRRTLALYLLAGGIYVFGAIGFEMVSGNRADLSRAAQEMIAGRQNLPVLIANRHLCRGHRQPYRSLLRSEKGIDADDRRGFGQTVALHQLATCEL